jgi:DNA-binding response OmpR family regulator
MNKKKGKIMIMVAAQVCLLRRKLGKYGCEEMLETIYGLGYRFQDCEQTG